MPFNQMMLFPCELTLRSTPEGIRMFCEPVEEIAALHDQSFSWNKLTAEEANEKLKEVGGELLHLKMDVEIVSSLRLELFFKGDRLLNYDGNFNQFNGVSYSSDEPGSFRFNIEVLIDRTSAESYIDAGKLFLSQGITKKKPEEGLILKGKLKIHSLELHNLKSIW